MHPELLFEHDEGVGSRPELAPLAKQATDAPTELHGRLPSALQSVEEFAEFIQAVGSSIRLKLLLQSLIDTLGSL